MARIRARTRPAAASDNASTICRINSHDETGTSMARVHTRTEEDRKPILLNELNQPKGQEDDTVLELRRFLGTVAKMEGLVPVTVTDWRYMPTKEAIWEYVQKKYIIPEEGKSWVLAAVRDDWRRYKFMMKKHHYYKYTTDKIRLLNRPKHISEEKFKELLKYWNSPWAKNITKINTNNRSKEKNRNNHIS